MSKLSTENIRKQVQKPITNQAIISNYVMSIAKRIKEPMKKAEGRNLFGLLDYHNIIENVKSVKAQYDRK